MSPSMSQSIRETFHIHALRHEAKILLTGRQWDQHNKLSERCQKASDKETNLLNERFEARMTQEYKKLLNERTSVTKRHKPNFAQDDLFDRTTLLKQADTNVRNRHERRLAFIEQYETQRTEALLQRSSRENQITGQSKDAFARAADRRSGEERRTRKMGEQNQSPVHRQTRS